MNKKALTRVLHKACEYLDIPSANWPKLNTSIKPPDWVVAYIKGGTPGPLYGMCWIPDNTKLPNRIWINLHGCDRDGLHPVRVLMHEVKHLHNEIVLWDEWDETLAEQWEGVLYDLWAAGGLQ